ncbi:MAG TPA: NlpC/P60 family protein [Rubrobacter sp.]|nr:NlpC/P60 family protein [Rubrobacter sp.]
MSFSTLAAEAQSADQYESSNDAEVSQDSTENPAPEQRSSGASSSSDGFVSQGSAVDPDSPEAVAAQKDLAEEEGLPDYSQVVDNTTKGAFRAPGWKVERGSLSHGGSFVAAEGAKAPARFGVKIPSSNDYSVYAWWPEISDGGTARFGVQTASGMKWSKVEQGADSSGMWVKIGSFDMKEGRRSVQVAARSAGGGRVVADAVAVVRGEAAPPEEQTMTASGERSTTDSKAISSFSGRDVVRKARRHLGDRYRYGTCTRTTKSCTCLTKKAVQPFGHDLPMTEGGQWRYDFSRKIPKSNLRRGDEVFFKEYGSRSITHVGIYSGNGWIVHASSYFGKVVEKKMKYIDGYYGAKRFKSR